MFAYPCGTTYSVTLVTAHAQCILVNHKVKGCLYMSHEMSSDVCGTSYCVTLVTTHAQYKKHEFYRFVVGKGEKTPS